MLQSLKPPKFAAFSQAWVGSITITVHLKPRPLSTLRCARRPFAKEARASISSGERISFDMGDVKEGLLVYGATGHTGKLVANKAKSLGIKATLAGRNAAKLKQVASETGLPYEEAFDLSETAKLDAAVARHKAVLHIAGPFTETGAPMVEACIRSGAHYIDITGEIGVVNMAKKHDEEAKQKGVMLLPAAGFDVVPGDCLAAHLKRKLPSATHLELATFIVRWPGTKGSALPSHGTLKSGALHIVPYGGLVRKNGEFVKEIIGNRTRKFATGDGETIPAFSFPAAELVCTAHSTGIPNITTFIPGSSALALRPLEMLGPAIVNSWPVKKAIEFAIARLPQPDTAKGESSRMVVSAEARDEASGKSASATISVGNGYPFTASAACEIARRVVEGHFTPGFQTPASAYGPDLVIEIPGEKVERIDA